MTNVYLDIFITDKETGKILHQEQAESMTEALEVVAVEYDAMLRKRYDYKRIEVEIKPSY